MKQTSTQGTKLIGVAGGRLLAPVKMSGKLKYLRKSILNFLCIIHWIIGAREPTRKKNTRP